MRPSIASRKKRHRNKGIMLSGTTSSQASQRRVDRTEGVGTGHAFTSVAVLIFSALFLLEIGIRNGAMNQVFYLLDGMNHADPDFLRGDWYTLETVKYHWIWSKLVEILSRNGLLELGLFVGTVLMHLGFAVALYAGLRGLYRDALLPWAITLLLFAGHFTGGIGDMQLLPTSIEPFGIAGVLTVGGLACAVYWRPLFVGILFGASGLVHAHFALLCAGMLGLFTLISIRTVAPRDLVKLWLPFLIIAAPGLISVSEAASVPVDRKVYEVLVLVAPQHYLPWRGDWRPLALLGSALLLGIGGALVRPPEYDRWRHVAVFLIVSLFMTLGGMLVCQLDLFWSVNRALPWRVSSVVVLGGLTAGAAALAAPTRSRITPLRRWTGWLFLGAGAMAGFAGGTARLWLALLAAFFIAAAGAALAHPAIRCRLRPSLVFALPFAATLGGMVPVAVIEVTRSHLTIRAMEGQRAPVYDWLRSAAPPGSLFIVPPDFAWRDFRLQTGRPLVADWWSPPLFGADTLEWYRRLQDLSGMERPRTIEDMATGYERLDCRRIEKLRLKYGVRYAILPAGKALPCGRPVYEDISYTVFLVSRDPALYGKADLTASAPPEGARSGLSGHGARCRPANRCMGLHRADLVFCPVDTGAKSFEFGQNGLGGGGPDERSAGLVVVGHEVINLGNRVAHRVEPAAPDGPLADQGEEALDQIEPRAVGRDGMAVPARPRGEPGLDLGMLVGGVVVEDDVDLAVGRHGLLDRAQEAEELLVPVPRAALRQDGAVEQVEGSEQRGGAMAEVVVGHALDVAEAQRQQRLGAFERLNLAFLVEAQDQRLVGGASTVQPRRAASR